MLLKSILQTIGLIGCVAIMVLILLPIHYIVQFIATLINDINWR